MKKIILSSIAAAVLGVSLNATVYATVNGEDVNDQDIAVLMRAMQGAKFEELPADAKQKINAAQIAFIDELITLLKKV